MKAIVMVAWSAWAATATAAPSPETRVKEELARLRDHTLSPTVRANAAGELGNFGAAAQPAVPELAAALNAAEVEPVRRNAAISLGRLTLVPQTSVPALVLGLGDASSVVRESAARAAAQFGTDAVAPLTQTVQSGTGVARAYAALALALVEVPMSSAAPALVDALSDRDAELRVNAALALGHAKATSPEVVAGLAAVVGDGDVRVRRSALLALKELGPEAKAALPAVVRTLRVETEPATRKVAAEALGAFGAASAATVPDLVEALGDRNEYTREEVVRALGSIGPKARAAVPALQPFLKDEDEDIREAAEDAVARIGK
jgi:HEAT repeat protein